MIYFDSSCCPETKEEAFKLQEQTVYLYYHMKLLKHALDTLHNDYFAYKKELFDEDLSEKAYVAITYESIKMQLETAETLLDDCLEYISLLRGEESVYGKNTDETIASRDKIRTLQR